MKRFATLLLALVMILSLAVPAFAEDATDPAKNNSITVTGTKAGETYNLYKLFDLSVDLTQGEKGAFTYTVNSVWAAFFADVDGETPAGAGRQYITIDAQGYVTDISDPAALAKAAEAYAVANDFKEILSKKAEGESVVFEGLEDGYYLITSTLGTIAMTETTPGKEDVTVEEKNPEDTISKDVQEDSTQAWGDKNDAQIGDTVYFKSTINLVVGTRNVVVHDTMDAGLTLNADSITIVGLTKGTDYTVVTTGLTDGCTFEVVITDGYVNKLTANTPLSLTYNATLNAKTVEGNKITEQKNVTKVTFGDAQTSAESETTTTTHKFAVNKYAGKDENKIENLAGAVFSLKKDDKVVTLVAIDENNYRVAEVGENGVATFTTNDKGDIVIWGVDADEYTLEEITPPAGYNELEEEVKFTVLVDNTLVVDVENNAGSELPSTGGMGTTLFYMVGGIMVLAAVVLLVTKKRMSVAE